jgi:NAD(P)-dependent dehydrogenase (short-subunit alcohol dehydrogenase family)
MARIFITGSSDGLGLMVGRYLADQSHKIVLHARNDARAADAKKALPKAEAVVVGDLATIAAAKEVAAQVNALGSFDGVIHNAAVGFRERHRLTSDGLPHVLAINTLAPYLLTALIERPKRLVYLSSGMHDRAHANLDDILWRKRRWDGSTAYSESKLHDVMLAFGVARLWPDVLSNALTPGWVPTKMGERRRARRHGSGPPHPSMAGDQRRTRRADDRRLLLPFEAARAEPRVPGCRLARQAHRHLPGGLRGRAASDLRVKRNPLGGDFSGAN